MTMYIWAISPPLVRTLLCLFCTVLAVICQYTSPAILVRKSAHVSCVFQISRDFVMVPPLSNHELRHDLRVGITPLFYGDNLGSIDCDQYREWGMSDVSVVSQLACGGSHTQSSITNALPLLFERSGGNGPAGPDGLGLSTCCSWLTTA